MNPNAFPTFQIQPAILANRLKSKFTFENKKELSDELHLERVLFYSDGDEMQPHKIYIDTRKPESAKELVIPGETVLFCMGICIGKEVDP